MDMSRRLQGSGTACVASGLLGLAVGVFTLSYPEAVADDVWSYPFPYGVGLALGLVLAATHLLTLAGFDGARVAQDRQSGQGVGLALWLALAGFALLAACEVASGFIGNKLTDSGVATIVGSAFGVASLLIAVGSVWSGVALLRRRAWSPSGAWAMTASGVVMILLVTPANISGNLDLRTLALMVWSAWFIPLGLSVRRPPRYETATTYHPA